MKAKQPIIIASDGNMTMIYSKGRIYGDHIKEFVYSHKAGDKPAINILTDQFPVDATETEIESFKQYFEQLLKQ